MQTRTILKIFFLILFLGVLSLLVFSLFQEEENSATSELPDGFPYDLEHPLTKFYLPSELREISGLSYYAENTLASIEDENGIIFMLDYTTGRITDRYSFGKDGDYEDLAAVDGKLYTMRSSSKIYRVVDLGPQIRRDRKYSPMLPEKSNAEGLCYYAAGNCLLIACKNYKGPPSYRGGMQNKKMVYAFDLTTETLRPEPAFILDFETLSTLSGRTIVADTFKPSGIAVHPLTGRIYLISSIAKQMLVVTPEGEYVYLRPLPSRVFTQPEGICFLPNGDLLITNEGQDANSDLLRFEYTPTHDPAKD